MHDSNYDSDSDDYVAAISKDATNQFDPSYAKIQLWKFTEKSIAESGNVCRIIAKTLANCILQSFPSAQWITSKCEKDLKIHSNEPNKAHGRIATTVVYNDRLSEDACFTVSEDGHKLIIGWDLFSSLGLAVVQQSAKRGKCVNNMVNSTCKVSRLLCCNFSASF